MKHLKFKIFLVVFLLIVFSLFYVFYVMFCVSPASKVIYVITPGPKYSLTRGEIWPKPQYQVKENGSHYVLGSRSLNVTIPYHTCDILEKGIKRLLRENLIRKQSLTRVSEEQYKADQPHGNFSKMNYTLRNIEFRIELTNECENYPHLDMDEKYHLTVREPIVLSSASIWGIIRGLQTFNHLIYYSDDYTEMRINPTTIEDYPAYSYRGLLIDTGRHYLKLETINLLIDAMEMNKMNVLHWHIVDDQSFPYQSQKYPKLSEYGAFHPSMVYTKEDVQEVIERARLAGIRVIPEFDVPGHVRSWGNAYPSILTKCYSKNNTMIGLGPLNPIKNVTYTFLEKLYREVKEVFPDEYLHLGGDEVNTKCWISNPNLIDYMKKHKIHNPNMLQTEFMSKVKLLLPENAKYMLWQDVFDSGVSLPKKTILQVWRYKWISKMDEILKAGHRVVFSSSWYLDEIAIDWEAYFRADPRHMVFMERLNATGLQDIIGGEACMWGERADDTNIFPRVWPRTSAVAERLWTGMTYTDILPIDPVTDFARSRLEEHTCRMIQNGIAAEPPNGPGFCFLPGSHTSQSLDHKKQARRNRKRKID